MPARGVYSGSSPWAGLSVLNTSPPGQVLPPSIPGGTTRYYVAAVGGAYAWAFGGWAGPAVPLATLLGGLVVAPDTAAGVVHILAWWPAQTPLQLARVHANGDVHPVRGAYPLLSPAPRTNYATNPSLEAGLNGYVPGTGSPTLTQLTTGSLPDRGKALRATIASAGTCEVAVPHAFGVGTMTVGLGLRFSARPTAVTVTTGWVDVLGNALTATTATLSANEINNSVSQFGRQVLTLAPPPAATAATTVKVAATGLPAGATMDLDAVTIEAGVTSGSYLDGSLLGAQWLGTAELSASVLATMLTVDDAECPFDEPVIYILHSSALGGAQVSAPAILLSSDGTSWLTHPGSALPVRVQLREVPTLDTDIQQGVMWPVGARFPVVVTNTQRHAPRGTADFVYLSFAERAVLLEMMSDGSPLLLRTPVEFGYEATLWLAVGAVTEDRGARKPWHDTGVLSADFQQVDVPEVV